MDQGLIKKIITIILVIVLFVIVFRFVKWLAYTLLPVAVLICAAYIVYKVVKNK
ncbi:hypothetical protein [Acetivibrio cellulolyticus]|uniref:hypothetical protein n=1 Tax=Acetivibrio cellulolyticus TaxID=35830 RepID=UPI0001E2C1FB|nr:hypothetical protein [Acetivibrio cellulolyticus]